MHDDASCLAKKPDRHGSRVTEKLRFSRRKHEKNFTLGRVKLWSSDGFGASDGIHAITTCSAVEAQIRIGPGLTISRETPSKPHQEFLSETLQIISPSPRILFSNEPSFFSVGDAPGLICRGSARSNLSDIRPVYTPTPHKMRECGKNGARSQGIGAGKEERPIPSAERKPGL